MMNKAFETLNASQISNDIKNEAHSIKTFGVPFELNNRYRTISGRAFATKLCNKIFNYKIVFNASMLQTLSDEEIYKIVSHELSHIVAFHVNCFDHGYRWQTIDQAMGGSGEKYHSLKVVKNVVKRYTIKDLRTNKEYKISTRMYNQISHLVGSVYMLMNVSKLNY